MVVHINQLAGSNNDTQHEPSDFSFIFTPVILTDLSVGTKYCCDDQNPCGFAMRETKMVVLLWRVLECCICVVNCLPEVFGNTETQ